MPQEGDTMTKQKKGKQIAQYTRENYAAYQETERRKAWAKRQAANGKHSIFRKKRQSKQWVCICGELVAETKPEAEFHKKYPHMTTHPEDWNPQVEEEPR